MVENVFHWQHCRIPDFATLPGKYKTEFVCRVDGEVIGSYLLSPSSISHMQRVRYLTPWLKAGSHELSFELQNFENGVEFSFGDIALCTPVGPDSDGNGVSDWMDGRLAFSRSDRGGFVQSLVSPFCLRGKASNFRAVNVSGDARVRPLPCHGWYSDIELSATGVVNVAIEYEHGMKREMCSIEWVPFDVMTEHEAILRVGDSMRLTAGFPAVADSLVFVNGALIAIGNDVEYKFENPGVFEVEGRTGSVTNVVRVEVVSARLPDLLPVRKAKVNTLRANCTGVEGMLVAVDQGGMLTTVATNGDEYAFSVSVEAFGRPTCVSLELSNPDASVAGVTELKPFSVHYTLEGVYYEAHRFRDGSVLVENRVSTFDMPACADLRMTSSSGISFVDGSARIDLSSEDFDETGDFIYQFIVPPGVSHPCQFLRLLYDGKVVAQ